MSITFNPALLALNITACSPDDAIKYAGNLLIEHDICSADYLAAMLEVYHQFGAYIVLDTGIAMPHARPEQGALQTGLALITLRKPLSFGHDEFDPVRIIIAIATTDSASHIKLIQLVATLIDNGVSAVCDAASDVTTIYHFIQSHLEQINQGE